MSSLNNFGLSPNHTMEIKKDKGTIGYADQPQKVVLFGFSYEDVPNKFSSVISEKKAIEVFGEGSMLHKMAKSAFDTLPSVDLYAYVLGKKARPNAESNAGDGGGGAGGGNGDTALKAANKKVKEAVQAKNDPYTISFDEIPDEQYTQFVLPYFDKAAIELFVEELDSRWNPDNQIDGHLFVADDTNDVAKLIERYENAADKLANSKHLTVIDTMGNSKETWIWAATLAAVNAKYASTPSRPYSTLELPGVNSFDEEVETRLIKARSRELRNKLLEAGVSTIKVSSGHVFIDRLVTTYSKEDSTETPDDSYRDLNAKQTISAIRYDWLNFVNKKFSRFVISQDETQKGSFIATPKSVMGLIIARHETWLEKLLVQDPEDKFVGRASVGVSSDGEHFITYLPVHLMGQLRGTSTILAFGKGKV